MKKGSPLLCTQIMKKGASGPAHPMIPKKRAVPFIEAQPIKKKRAASDPKVASDEEASGAGGNGGAGGTASTSERRDVLDRFARLRARGAAVMQGAAGTAILDELCQCRNEILVEKNELDHQVKWLDRQKVDFDKAIARMGEMMMMKMMMKEDDEASTQQVKEDDDDDDDDLDSGMSNLEEGELALEENHWQESDYKQGEDSEVSEEVVQDEEGLEAPGLYTTKSIVMHHCRVGVIHKNGNLTRSWQGGPVGLPKRKQPNIGNLCRYWQQFRGCKNGSNCKWFHDMSLEHRQRTLYVDRKPQHKHCGKLRTHLRAPPCS